MDFELSDEQQLIRDAVREFAEAEIVPIAAEIDRDHRFPAELLPKLAEMNLMGMTFPEKEGGAGTDYVSYVIAVEEISRACASTGIIMSSHNSLATWPIYTFGTRAQKDQYMHDMTSGRRLGAFALTEPAAGTDAAAGTCTATRDRGRICPQRVQDVHHQRTARRDLHRLREDRPDEGTRGISAFIVESDTPGFSVGEAEHKMGIRGSSTPPIYFTDCRVPKEALLGEEGEGFKIAMADARRRADRGFRAGAGHRPGGARSRRSTYAKERVQFGKPIANLQAIQWMIADMRSGYRRGPAPGLSRRMRARAAAAPIPQRVRWPSCSRRRLATRVAGKAIQIHGGYGYTEAYPVERHYRDAKITELYEGTSEVQRMVIARNALR